MTKDRSAIGGVLPVVQMSYLDNDQIDFATLQREVEWLYQCGADGIVFAMVSEVLRLSETERQQVGECLVRWSGELGSRNSGCVILSVGAESTFLACENARRAEQAGADAVMAIPPIAVAADHTELLKYYQYIVEAISLPVIVQDASGYVGQPLSIAMQAELLKACGADRIWFKPEAVPIGPRLSALRDATDGQARIFEGTGGIALVDSYRRGIVGTMPGSDLIRGIVELYRALQANDERRIYQISLPVSAIIAVQHSLDAFLAIEKHLLVRQGIFHNTRVRGPTAYQLDQQTREEIDRLFDLLSLALEAT